MVQRHVSVETGIEQPWYEHRTQPETLEFME